MSFCLNTCVRLTVCSMVSFHALASNANVATPFATGGSWKKSPVMTSWERLALYRWRVRLRRKTNLNPSKRHARLLPNCLCNRCELVEEESVDHRD